MESAVFSAVAIVNWRGARGKPRDLLYHDLVSLIAHERVQALARDLVQPPDLLDMVFFFFNNSFLVIVD